MVKTKKHKTQEDTSDSLTEVELASLDGSYSDLEVYPALKDYHEDKVDIKHLNKNDFILTELRSGKMTKKSFRLK